MPAYLSARTPRLGFLLMFLMLLGLLLPMAQAQTAGQVRYFPRPGYESRMVGGQFQGSPDNATWQTLYTVTAAPSDVYTTATTSADPKTFRYLRYLAPDGSYGNVAEIEFDSGGVKLTGAAFGTPGSYANSGNDFTKVFDGDTTTFFDAPYPGNGDFAGIDQGSASVLTSIAVSPTSAALNTGGTQQFTATALDQNGNALSPQPAFTWSTSGVGTIGGSTGLYTAGSTPGSATVQATSGSVSGTASVTVTASGSQAQLLAINAGGGTVGSFAADTDYSGGSTDTVTSAITTSGVTSPAPQAVYQSERWGNFTYTLPGFTPGGSYTLRLHFAETYYGPGQPGGGGTGSRQFNVAINGTPVLNNFDIFAAAGGADIALVKSYPATADASGNITVAFTNGAADNAKISGIEVLAGAPATGGIIYGAPSGSQAAPDIPPPGWAEEVMPTDDSSDADGMGPSMGGPVNTASGVEENSPGADLWAYNPLGPSASYSRMYRSARAVQGYHSPGLSAGWVDNYDQSITITGSTYTRVYPNGGQEAWGGTTGALTPPSGAPYTAVQTPAAGGKPAFITVTEKDRSQEIFTQIPTAAGPYPAGTYLLSQVTNLVGHSVFLNRDASGSAYRVLSITNDAATPLALLSFTYAPSGLLASVTDSISAANPAGIRQVAYTFTGGNLSAVSQIAAPGAAGLPTRWGYGYTPSPTNGQPLLIQVQAPNPASPGTLASTYTDYYDTGAVAEHIDATGRVKSYAYNGSQTQIQADNADGSLAQSWTQKQNTGSKNQDAGVVDAKGKATSVAYSGTPSPYLPSAETNRNGQTTSVNYFDSYGNLATVTSPRNVVTTFTYGNPTDFALNQVASVQRTHLDASGVSDSTQTATTFDYYGSSDVPTDGGPAGTINGLVKAVHSPYPYGVNYPYTITTTYTYDSLGNISQLTTPNAYTYLPGSYQTTTYNYTSYNFTDAKSVQHSYSQSEALGEPVSVTVTGPDSNSSSATHSTTTTYYQYDQRGNKTAVIDALGNETDFVYNLADQLIATLYPATGDSGSGQAKMTTTYQYPGGPASSTSLYDESGNLFRQVNSIYGPEGELTSVSGDTNPVSYGYDGRGRVSSVTYYQQQSLMSGKTTYYDYDAVGNQSSIRYPNQNRPTFDMLQYFYDDEGNLTKEIDGNNLEKDYLRVDPESLLTGIHYVYPSGYNGTQTADVGFTFDAFGRRASMTDGTGSKTYSYSDLDYLLNEAVNFNGGPQNQTLQFKYYQDGSCYSMKSSVDVLQDSNYTRHYYTTHQNSYDGLGRPSATSVAIEESITAPKTSTTKYTYDVESLSDNTYYSYYANNWLQTYSTQGTAQGPRFQVQYSYNPRGFLSNLTNSQRAPRSNNALPLLSMFSAMTYDPAGNRLQETASIPAQQEAFGYGVNNYYIPVPDASRTIAYSYNDRDELINEQSRSTPSASNSTDLYSENYAYSFGYDFVGNSTTFRGSTGQFNSDNQSSTTTPDGNGNPISYQGSALQFDSEDRLTSVPNMLSAAYDGDGLRAWKQDQSGTRTYYLYDGDTPLFEEFWYNSAYDPTSLIRNHVYVSGPAGLIFSLKDDQVRFDEAFAETYLYDPQGNLVERAAGAVGYNNPYPNGPYYSSFSGVRNVTAYDAFGTMHGNCQDGSFTPSSTVKPSPFGFGGQHGYYTDSETGLSLLTHRYYDAGTGRFVNRDPIGYKGGINLYGFAGNNPVNRQDPNGTTPSGRYSAPPPDSGGFRLTTDPAVMWENLSSWGHLFGSMGSSALDNTLRLIQHLDATECGCGPYPQASPGAASRNAPMQMAGKGGGKLPGGLNNASTGLKELFSEGSLKGRSIIGIRQTLMKNGFKMSKADTNGYIFRMPGKSVEHVRIMSRAGGWDVRVQNEGGGWLDEVGNQVTGRSASHGINVFSK